MLTYEMNIAGLRRDLPLCRVSDDVYIGAFVIFGDVELTVHCATELLKRAPEYDYLIAPEAKSIPLLYEMARQSGAKKYFLARKGPKLYMTGVFEVTVRSITTMSLQKLVLDVEDAELMRGKRILIAGDAVMTKQHFYARATEFRPDPALVQRAVETLEDIAQSFDIVLPGHDNPIIL